MLSTTKFFRVISTFLIEICTPCDHNVVEWHDRKSVKYQALVLDKKYITGKPCQTMPIAIGATGVACKDLTSKVKELNNKRLYYPERHNKIVFMIINMISTMWYNISAPVYAPQFVRLLVSIVQTRSVRRLASL